MSKGFSVFTIAHPEFKRYGYFDISTKSNVIPVLPSLLKEGLGVVFNPLNDKLILNHPLTPSLVRRGNFSST
jgi:hypothetical protein